MTRQFIIDKMAGTMNGLGFSVDDGIKIANAATSMFTNVYDVTKNKKSASTTTTTNTTPQVVYVQQPTGSSTSTYTPNYYQTQNNDNTLLYVALGGLALFAMYFLTKKK